MPLRILQAGIPLKFAFGDALLRGIFCFGEGLMENKAWDRNPLVNLTESSKCDTMISKIKLGEFASSRFMKYMGQNLLNIVR